ncbi:uncharacterized protein LOC111122646 [Crassostrea virginica]
MQASSIAASVVISCLLNTLLDFFKDTTSECNVPETNNSHLIDLNNLELHIRNHEAWVTKIMQGNITALETKLLNTRETTLGQCQKVVEYLQTNRSQMLVLQENQRVQQKQLADQENKLHTNDQIIAGMGKQLENLELNFIRHREPLEDEDHTDDTSTSLTQRFSSQFQAFLPITVFLLTVGELVLFLLVFLSRRETPKPRKDNIPPSSRGQNKPNRPRRDV